MARAAPRWIAPAHLSTIGAGGAALAAAALVGCRSWPELVWLVPPAMFVNWFGLTTDLPLARLRGGERPGAGMSHHVSELFSHILLIVAYGFSPFLTLRAAAAVLVLPAILLLWLHSRRDAPRSADGLHWSGRDGVPHTSGLLAFRRDRARRSRKSARSAAGIDVAVIGLALVAVLGLFGKLFKDGRRIAAASAQSSDE
ncbi:MAG: hypothetical protein ACXW3V_05815 [Methylocystis sp.]